MCVCVCERERERERERGCVRACMHACVRACVRVCVCVCVRERERERERGGICVGGCGLLACVNARNVRNTEKGIRALFFSFFRRAFKHIRKNYNSYTLRKAHASTIRY